MRTMAHDKRLQELEQRKVSQVKEKLRWHREIFCDSNEQSREERI